MLSFVIPAKQKFNTMEQSSSDSDIDVFGSDDSIQSGSRYEMDIDRQNFESNEEQKTKITKNKIIFLQFYLISIIILRVPKQTLT